MVTRGIGRCSLRSIPTIKRLEAHDGALRGRHETGTKIRFALEVAGIDVIDENGGGAEVPPSQAATEKKIGDDRPPT